MLSLKARTILGPGRITMHVSPGNSKMGPIPSMNLMPVETCSGSTPGCRKHCYSRKGIDFRSNMREVWEANTHAWVNHQMVAKLLMDGWICEHRPEVFRIHGSGDFISPDHIAAWSFVAAHNPDTLFYGFSKAPFDLSSTLPNFRIRRSFWSDSPLRAPEVPTAWVSEHPGNLKLLHELQEVPVDAVTCPATIGRNITCDECRWCFTKGWDDCLPVEFRRH